MTPTMRMLQPSRADDAGTSDRSASTPEQLYRELALILYRGETDHPLVLQYCNADVRALFECAVRSASDRDATAPIANAAQASSEDDLRIVNTSTEADESGREMTVWLTVVASRSSQGPLGHVWETTVRLEWQLLRRGWICVKYRYLRGSAFAPSWN